ncbi:Hypothetical predicted protein [Octopus vulgaris]|uniref:Uncharacterized protein n=1 Tax=Octopus vulgaris TaxID=6645 RepID=A0AA36FL71_OCTVU|nr:Hypothetical predicted protein [Octopus vulgaris]
MQPHIANTKVTTVQAHEEREKVLNAHMMMWTIVLGPQKRTAKNFQAWNNDIPALYGLRKDHKENYAPFMSLAARKSLFNTEVFFTAPGPGYYDVGFKKACKIPFCSLI